MMKGLPCSGKTEWATEWVNKKTNRVRLSWSDVLLTIGDRFRGEHKLLAFEGFLRML